MKRAGTFIGFIIGLIIITLLSCCSSQWHLRQALKKDPTLATKEEPTITKLDSPPVDFSFNCDSIRKNGVTFIVPRETRTLKGETRVDSIPVTLTAGDSLTIMASVECPPAEEVECDDPQIIELKPSIWDWIKIGFTTTFGLIFILLLVFIFRKFLGIKVL